MRKLTLLFSFIVCVIFAKGQILVNENFDYAVGSGLIGQGGWAIVGTSVVNPINLSAGTINYSGYPSSGIGQELSINTNGQDVTKAFTAQLTGDIYFSCIVNVQTAKSTYRGDYFIHVVETGSTSALFGRVFVKQVGAKLSFGILNATGGSTFAPTFSNALYELNTSYLIVVKINASTAVSSLIINPVMSTEPTSNWITNSTGGTSIPLATKGIGGVNIRQGSDSIAPTLKLDGIRVATSWSALFSTTGINNPASKSFSAIVSGKNLLVKNVANGSVVEIYSALGSKVQASPVENGKVGLSNLSRGMYIVRVNNMTQKIMY